jgi:site-specific recombinase XerD
MKELKKMDAINEFLAHLEIEGYSKNTIRAYRSALSLLVNATLKLGQMLGKK